MPEPPVLDPLPSPWTRRFLIRSGFLLATLAFAGCDRTPTESPPSDLPTEPVTAKRVQVANGVVAAATPFAAEAGREILMAGGNAADAAVAAAFAVGVTEPGGSSVGGGGAMTLWVGGRADHIQFYSSAGGDRTTSGRARNVAVPGKVAGLLEAHQRYGVLPREEVMAPAIRLAREGFPVYPRLASQIASYPVTLTRHPSAAQAFYPGGSPVGTGELLIQSELAQSLERIALQGRSGFYTGPTADALIEKLQGLGSPMTAGDLAGYEPRWQRPLCGAFRELTVLSSPPPMSGIEVIQTLVLLDVFPLEEMGRVAQSPLVASRYSDALRLARAERASYLGDPLRGVPAVGIVSRTYANERRGLMGGEAPSSVSAGTPWAFEDEPQPERCMRLDPYGPSSVRPGPGAGVPEPDDLRWDDTHEEETTHLSVIDREGNAVSITMTLGPLFGAGVYSGGAFYNNALSRFSSRAVNRWAPYHTPQSSIGPTLVLEGDEVRLAAGSPGGLRIPQATLHTILHVLEYELDPAVSVNLPRLYATSASATIWLESGFESAVRETLESRGYAVNISGSLSASFGGVNAAFLARDGSRIGVGDPRRAGEAAGY